MPSSPVASQLTARGGRLLFNRPPRVRRSLSQSGVRVPSPPPRPTPPQTSVVTSLGIPLTTSLLMGSVYFLMAMQSTQGGSAATLMQVTAVAMMISSSLPVIWMFFSERREYQRTRHEGSRQFRARLAEVRRTLEALRAEEIELRQGDNPAREREEVRSRILGHSPRLWERRPGDGDFLQVRLGTGRLPSLVRVECQPPEEGYDLAREAFLLAEEFRQVEGVPVTSDLVSVVGLGLAGPRKEAAALARSLLVQIAAHHSAEEVRIVAFFGEARIPEWAWLKWLPHTQTLSGSDPGDRLLAWDRPRIKHLTTWLVSELANRERSLAETKDPSARLPHLVVVMEDFDLLRGEPALEMLFGRGKELGASLLCLAEEPSALPGECAAVLELGRAGGGRAVYSLAGPAPAPLEVAPDSLSADEAETLARALAPLVVVKTSSRAQDELPSRLGFLETMGLARIEDLDARERWERSRTDLPALLRAPIGIGAGGAAQELDLKDQGKGGHGPHGLVAGTTGSGKSELLRSMVAALAAQHSPETLTFLLVDYKGGDAFGVLEDLPHVVGMVTDLHPALADRAIVALRAELKKRERLQGRLKEVGAGNLEEYQRLRGNRDPMPFLFIVVDEFAQMKSEMPEFIQGLIEVARIGRSLGVRLLLATQTPSGVVDDEIKKNSNYGICLRVRDAGDSREVIGRPEAAMLPGRIPGRAYLSVGSESLFPFQSAYVSGRYEPRSVEDDVTVRDFAPLVGHRGAVDAEFAASISLQAARETELSVLVERLKLAAAELNVRPPERPWLDPLPEELPLEKCGLPPMPEGSAPYLWPEAPTFGAMVAPVGLLDEPSAQRQGPFLLDLAQYRHLLVIGAPGSGKSTFLRTLALSLARTHTPQQLHLYCIDFGSRALKLLEGLPHSGGVLQSGDTDKIKRLLRMLSTEMVRRKLLLSEAEASNLQEYNREGFGPPLPNILVMLDNYAAFREKFQEEERTLPVEETIPQLVALLREGAAMGVYFVIATSSFGTVNTAVASLIETRIALRQVDATDYRMFGSFERLPGRLAAGRGYLAATPPLEFQTAIATGVEAVTARGIVEKLSSSWTGPRPRVVESLPDLVRLDRLLESGASEEGAGVPRSGLIALGLDDETMEPALLDLRRETQLLIMGPGESGKSSLLATCLRNLMLSACLLNLAQRNGGQGRDVGPEIYLTAPRPSPVRALVGSPRVKRVARDLGALGTQLDELEERVRERIERSQTGGDGARDGEGNSSESLLVVAIDDYDALLQEYEFTNLSMRLRDLIKRGSPYGLRVLVAGLNSNLRTSSDYLLGYLFENRVAVLLQPDLETDGGRLYVNLKRFGQANMPPGRGYLMVRESVKLVQAASWLEQQRRAT